MGICYLAGIFGIVVLLYLPHPSISSPAIVNKAGILDLKNGVKSSKLDHSLPSRYLPKKCEAGKVYNITSVQDLHDNGDELECIFEAGLSPSKIPEGPLYGTLLHVANYRIFNPFFGVLWQGKNIEKFNCSGNEVYRGWNSFAKQPVFTFVATIGKISQAVSFHPLEVHTDKEALLIDYTKSVYDICPNLDSIIDETRGRVIVQKSSKNTNFHPFTQNVDVVLLVGRQPDGSSIFLGKMYGKDAFASDKNAKCVCYFSLINYDQTVNPEFKSGDALPALEKTFYYRLAGMIDLLMWILPHDNFFSEPIHCCKEMLKEIIPSCRGLFNFVLDFLMGIGGGDAMRLNKILEEGRLTNVTNISLDDGLDKRLKTAYFMSHHSVAHKHFNEL